MHRQSLFPWILLQILLSHLQSQQGLKIQLWPLTYGYTDTGFARVQQNALLETGALKHITWEIKTCRRTCVRDIEQPPYTSLP